MFFSSLLQVAARVVGLLVTDFAVDLEHAFDVFSNMCDDWTCEGSISVCINIRFDDSVVEDFANVAEFRTGSAVEDEVETLIGTILFFDSCLTITKDGWLKLNRAWLVSAVYIAEGCREDKASDAVEVTS